MKNKRPTGFGEIIYLSDFKEEADKLQGNFGKTEMYSTGIHGLDGYLGGGFGREGGYEIVVLYGEPGNGKSSVALQMLEDAVKSNVPQGWIILEDAIPDVYNRLRSMNGDDKTISVDRSVRLMPPRMLESGFSLDNILDWIKLQNDNAGTKLFLLDHIQFAFENAESIQQENEYIRQRKFLKQLNFLCKSLNLTIVMVSHTNKNTNGSGLSKILGTSAIAQVATKAIEIKQGTEGRITLQLHKTRFTEYRSDPWIIQRDGFRFIDIPVSEQGSFMKKGYGY